MRKYFNIDLIPKGITCMELTDERSYILTQKNTKFNYKINTNYSCPYLKRVIKDFESYYKCKLLRNKISIDNIKICGLNIDFNNIEILNENGDKNYRFEF
jgi:hypothetical protein